MVAYFYTKIPEAVPCGPPVRLHLLMLFAAFDRPRGSS